MFRPFAAVVVVVDVPVADEKATLGFVGWGALEVQKMGEDAPEADAQVVAAAAATAVVEARLESDDEREEEEENEEEIL